ncbi:hypothetical protein [Delftia acidovorans]|uniref:hypothetical protein n=1 Tax=Delftia acidovorans TaxID=80866 RepID=UPI003D122E04
MRYGDTVLQEKTIGGQLILLRLVFEQFEEARASFLRDQQQQHEPARVNLVDFEASETIASFLSHDMCGMTPGLINDCSRYWLCTPDGRRSRDITLDQYTQIVGQHQAPRRAWIAGMFSEEVLTHNAIDWRPPTAWELRHIVGEGSLTGITGAAVAEMVGVSSANFRKYIARDDATTRQNMSFAMWHLLLHRLGVQRMPEGLGAGD